MDAPLSVYTEVQIDEDSISLSLISEGEYGVRVEDTERFTFDELQSLSGEHLSLRLSQETREGIDSDRTEALDREVEQLLSEIEQSESGQELPEVGDWVEDENPPSWTSDSAPALLRVEEVLSDVRADEYIIDGPDAGKTFDSEHIRAEEKTVASENPDYPADDPVVIGRYNAFGKRYAFPASRVGARELNPRDGHTTRHR